jgi:hypothetical protein
MWKLREDASSVQFRDSGPRAAVNLFAEVEHWHHLDSIMFEAKPSSAWRKWGFMTCTYTGEPRQRKHANPTAQAVNAIEADCGLYPCLSAHCGVVLPKLALYSSSRIVSNSTTTLGGGGDANSVELSPVKLKRLFWVQRFRFRHAVPGAAMTAFYCFWSDEVAVWRALRCRCEVGDVERTF